MLILKRNLIYFLCFNLPWRLHTDQLITRTISFTRIFCPVPSNSRFMSKAANIWCHWRNESIFIRKWNNLAHIFTFNCRSPISLPMFKTLIWIKSIVRRNSLCKQIILLQTQKRKNTRCSKRTGYRFKTQKRMLNMDHEIKHEAMWWASVE